MKYKMITSDFDGTLLNSNKEIGKKTKNTLRKLKEEGYIIVGITGRNFASATSVVDKSLFNYLILNNGAHIYDVDNDIDLFKSTIDASVLKELSEELKPDCKRIEYLSKHYYYRYIDKALNTSKIVKSIKDLDEIDESIFCIELFFSDELLLEDALEYINREYYLFAFIMQDSFASKKWIIVTNKNITKSFSLTALREFLKIKEDETIFFGDGLNDLEIFKSNIFSVAMSNALPEVKKASNDITLSSDDDGVSVYLEKII